MAGTPTHRSGCTLAARLLLGVGILLTGALPVRAEEAPGSRGEALYRTRCASCHEGGVARAPDTNALRQLRPERTTFALMFGMMSPQGRDLSQGEIQDIVRYLVGASVEQQTAAGFQMQRAGSRACGCFIATLERLGRRHRPTPVSTRRHGPAFAGQRSAPEAEMGVRLSWRHQGLCAADGLGWPGLRGQRGGQGLCAGCRDSAASAGCSTPASAYAPRSPSARTSAARRPISAINAVTLMRSMPRAGICCGRDESMRMREP